MSLNNYSSLLWGQHPSRSVWTLVCGAGVGILVLLSLVSFQPEVATLYPDSGIEYVSHIVISGSIALAVMLNYGIVPAYSLSVIPVYTLQLYNCCLVSRFHYIGVFPLRGIDFILVVTSRAGYLWAIGVLTGLSLKFLAAKVRRTPNTTATAGDPDR